MTDPRDADLVQLKVPPHSEEAEQSLLGGLMLDNQALDRVSFVEAEHFYRDDHRRIYRCLREMIERGTPADLVTVSEAMKASGELARTPGAAYIAELVQNTPTAAHIGRYAELVRNKAILRELAQRGTEIAEKALSGITDPREIAEEAEASILAVMDGAVQSGDIVHIGQACTEYVEWADAHPNGIETGFVDLDALIGGLLPGSLVIIGGRPSMGKTALALQFSERICMDVPGVMFSLEASRREIAGRMIEWHKQRAGRDAAVDKVFSLKLFVDDSSKIGPGMMRARLRRFKRQHGLSYVVVDYLQLMTGKGDSREQEVAYISRELKAIAKDFEVPVVALCQLGRRVEERVDKRPNMSDLRESGAIEQDADVILFPFRPDYYDTKFDWSLAEAEIAVPKNRQNGRTGLVKVSYSRDLKRYGDFVPGLNREVAA